MQVRILFFGRLADATQTSSTTMDNVKTLNDLEQKMIEKYPGLAEERYRIAVNKKIEEKEFSLSDGDEIALLPPYAGG